MKDFKRENRFIVIKRKHLSAVQEKEISFYLFAESIPITESVVVESDWPIYEETWENVQRIAEGRPSIKQALAQGGTGKLGHPETVESIIQDRDGFQHRVAELQNELQRQAARAVKAEQERDELTAALESVASLVELLGAVACAAYNAAEDSDECARTGQITAMPESFSDLSDALSDCESVPEPDDAYVSNGAARVLRTIRSRLAERSGALAVRDAALMRRIAHQIMMAVYDGEEIKSAVADVNSEAEAIERGEA